MVVRRTEKRDFGLATGWSEEDGTTTTYQPFARSVGSHRQIETGSTQRNVQQRAVAPVSLYPRRPSGVQPKVATPALDDYEALDLDELELRGNPFAPRRSAANASLWNVIGFAALFASVLIGRVIVDAGQSHARTGANNARGMEAPPPSAATATGSAGVGPDAKRNAAAAHDGSPAPADANAAAEGGANTDVPPSRTASAVKPESPDSAADSLPTAAVPSSRARSGHASSARSLQTRESIDWRDGPMEPATTSAPPGTLRINSRPWSQVFIDGRLIGNTPQMAVSVPAGRYTVRLSNPELGMSKTIILQVSAGELVTRVETLE